jgi:very-short-patch-repair endonuclease
MRQEMTPAEQVLWQAVKGRKLAGLKFRRQHPVGNFILDFYCPACHLVIELDGGVHDAQTEHDAARTTRLNAYGCCVIRFRNEEVIDDLPYVLERIRSAVTPLPKLGEGLGERASGGRADEHSQSRAPPAAHRQQRAQRLAGLVH